MQLTGVFSALLTPFHHDGASVNENELRRLVESGVASGLNGIVTCGSTAEFAALSTAERKRVLEVVTDTAAGRICVVAQIGATTTREACDLAKHAQATGANALILATPYYEPIQFDAVRRYYRDIASETDLPLCIYCYPDAMRVAYPAARIDQLMGDVKTVRYIKDSSGDWEHLMRLLSSGTGVEVFVGEDILVADAFGKGVCGSITGMANFLAPALAKMFAAARGGERAVVQKVWDAVSPLVNAVLAGHYNSGVKAVCEALGFAVGPVRAPYDVPFADRSLALSRLVKTIDPNLLNRPCD